MKTEQKLEAKDKRYATEVVKWILFKVVAPKIRSLEKKFFYDFKGM